MNWPLWKVTTPSCPLALAKSMPSAFDPEFGQLDHLGLQHHAVDGNVDHRDHRLESRDLVGRASQPDCVQAAVDRDRGVDRLAEGLVARSRRLGGRLRLVGVARQAVRSERWLFGDEDVVRFHGRVGEQADDLGHVGIFEKHQLVAGLAFGRAEELCPAAAPWKRASGVILVPRRAGADHDVDNLVAVARCRDCRVGVDGEMKHEDAFGLNELDRPHEPLQAARRDRGRHSSCERERYRRIARVVRQRLERVGGRLKRQLEVRLGRALAHQVDLGQRDRPRDGRCLRGHGRAARYAVDRASQRDDSEKSDKRLQRLGQFH